MQVENFIEPAGLGTELAPFQIFREVSLAPGLL